MALLRGSVLDGPNRYAASGIETLRTPLQSEEPEIGSYCGGAWNDKIGPPWRPEIVWGCIVLTATMNAVRRQGFEPRTR